jgi:hypothetical protein
MLLYFLHKNISIFFLYMSSFGEMVENERSSKINEGQIVEERG